MTRKFLSKLNYKMGCKLCNEQNLVSWDCTYFSMILSKFDFKIAPSSDNAIRRFNIAYNNSNICQAVVFSAISVIRFITILHLGVAVPCRASYLTNPRVNVCGSLQKVTNLPMYGPSVYYIFRFWFCKRMIIPVNLCHYEFTS